MSTFAPNSNEQLDRALVLETTSTLQLQDLYHQMNQSNKGINFKIVIMKVIVHQEGTDSVSTYEANPVSVSALSGIYAECIHFTGLDPANQIFSEGMLLYAGQQLFSFLVLPTMNDKTQSSERWILEDESSIEIEYDLAKARQLLQENECEVMFSDPEQQTDLEKVVMTYVEMTAEAEKNHKLDALKPLAILRMTIEYVKEKHQDSAKTDLQQTA